MRSRVLLLFQSLAWRLLFFFCFLHEIKSHGSDAYRVGEKKRQRARGGAGGRKSGQKQNKNPAKPAISRSQRGDMHVSSFFLFRKTGFCKLSRRASHRTELNIWINTAAAPKVVVLFNEAIRRLRIPVRIWLEIFTCICICVSVLHSYFEMLNGLYLVPTHTHTHR